MKASPKVNIEADRRAGLFKLVVSQSVQVEVFLPLLFGAAKAKLPAVEGLTMDEANAAKVEWEAYIAAGLKKCKIGLAT